jgi:hypothetical protein
MKYALVVPKKYRRHGGSSPRGAGGVPRTTRAQRMRILEVLRLSDDEAPPRVPGPEARRRIVEVLRLQAGLPATPSGTPLPRGRPEPIDLAQFDEDIAWMEARFHKRKGLFAAAGLREDGEGRVSCVACREVLAARPEGMPVALHPRSMAFAHSFTCPARKE